MSAIKGGGGRGGLWRAGDRLVDFWAAGLQARRPIQQIVPALSLLPAPGAKQRNIRTVRYCRERHCTGRSQYNSSRGSWL